MRNAFLNRGDFNFFTVDWGLGAGTPNYILARNRVNEVGQVLGQFIDFINVNGMPFSRIGINGHSLGDFIKNYKRTPILSIAIIRSASRWCCRKKDYTWKSRNNSWFRSRRSHKMISPSTEQSNNR